MKTSLSKHPTALKSLVAMVIAAFAFLAVPKSAEAGPDRRLSHRLSCGTPVYAYPKFVGYNSCGQRIYRYVVPRHQYRDRGYHYNRQRHYRRGPSKGDIISGLIRGVIDAKHGYRRGY